MRWLVGLDLNERSTGAARFAQQLRDAGDEVLGLHVVDEKYLMHALRYMDAEDVLSDARQRTVAALRAAGIEDPFDVRVSRGWEVEDALGAARERYRAAAFVVGRRAASESAIIVRLGRVARRLLRHTTVPAVVCPPDYHHTQPPPGPVLLAVDGYDRTSGAAAAFAQRMSALLGRPLAACHVADTIDDYLASHYISSKALEDTQTELRATGERRLSSWLEEHEVEVAASFNLQGHPTEQVLRLVNSERPALVVCGSRRLSGVERAFVSSVGSQLAAHAACPVAVVPPGT